MIAERTKHPLQLLAALLLALALLTGCGSSGSKKAIQQLQLGQQYLTGQNYTEAAAAFTEVLRLAPDNLPAYLGRAQAYAGLEQYDDAKTDYTSVIEKASSRPYTQAQAYAGRGDVWTLLGDPAQARSDYDLALQVLDGIDLSSVSDSVQENVKALTEQVQNALTMLNDGTTANVENGGEEQSQQTIDLPDSQEETNTVTAMQQLSVEELNAAKEKFQRVFDELQPSELHEGQYSNCPHYTIVGDYDGDGKLEAFGFIGVDSEWQPAPYWENLSMYYIDSSYHITPLLGNDGEYDSVNGSILCPEPNIKNDFSNCVYTSGTEQFLAWNVGYWDSDWFGLILSAHDGKPVVSYLRSTFHVNDNGQFATFDDNDNEVLLQLKDGQMVNA